MTVRAEDDGVIRLLIIGRDAEQWRRDLERWEGRSIEVDTETLPAAGVRNFTETTPDAVGIAEPDASPRIEPIAEALRERPLGRVVPVLTLGTPYRGDAELEIAGTVGADEGGRALIGELERLLEVELEPPPDRSATASGEELEVEQVAAEGPTHHSTEIPTVRDGAAEPGRGREGTERERAPGEGEAIEHRDYVIEPLQAPPDDERAEAAASEDRQPVPEPAGANAIRRKLEEVRHENYFEVLEISRSVDGDNVREAYRQLKTQFDPERIDPDDLEAFEEQLAEIHDALDDARAVLGDDELREAYRARTSSR